MKLVGSLLLMVLVTLSARAEVTYFDVPLTEIVRKPEAPATQPDSIPRLHRRWQMQSVMIPRVILSSGEGYITNPTGERIRAATDETYEICNLVAAAEAGKDLTGTIYLPKPDFSGMERFEFTLPAAKARAEAKEAFHFALHDWCEQRLNSSIPGAAWFRYRLGEARKVLGDKAPPRNDWRWNARRNEVIDETFDLFTGGRAVSENLQLDRVLRIEKSAEPTIDVSTIPGITVAAMDFKARIKDAKPQLDPLSRFIPEDQHAIFFPSFKAFSTVLDSVEQFGTPAVQWMEPRTEDYGTKAKYERQLGLEMNALSKLLGEAMVTSVAISGSDPYLRVGSDLLLVYEAKEPAALKTLLAGKIGASTALQPKTETIENIETAVFRDDDRGVRCYLALLDGAVMISNSPAQIAAVGKVIANTDPSIEASPEYVFFRTRYVKESSDESAFVILTDATIRRWCSARWRIADSRRTRVAAMLAQLQAASESNVIGATDDALKDQQVPGMGIITMSKSGPVSTTLGTLTFMTPISEMDVSLVSEDEKLAYERWRQQYQSNWRGVFDPIAAKLVVNDAQIGLDLSVMPLIAGTDYRQFIDLTKDVAIKPDSGDPHNAPMHAIMAINAKSGLMRSANTLAMGVIRGILDPLSWIGPTISLYADDDPMWREFAGKSEQQIEEFLKQKGYALPIGLYVESTSALKLAAFMTGVRAAVDQSAPNMAIWETIQQNGRSYVKVTGAEETRRDTAELQNLALFYATTPKGLLVSLNEGVVQRGLDRLTAAATTQSTTQPATQPASPPWLSESLGLQVQTSLVIGLSQMIRDEYQSESQRRAWGNIPILNEWKRLNPQGDPQDIHQKKWGCRLLDPSGGTYAWNEKDQTMESTVYGHPGLPKKGPELPEAVRAFTNLNAGVTFENQGLRAKAELERAK